MNFTTPIQMQRSTHYGNDYYLVFSTKANRPVQLFSKLEYYNFLSLETDPNVETICEQPCQIEIVDDDKIKHAIFDMYVKYKDGREELQEVKYTKELEGDSKAAIRSQEQIRRQRIWCEENHIPFAVRTEKELIDGDYVVQNRSVLAGLIRRYTPGDAQYYNKLVIRYISDAEYSGRKKVSFGELLKAEFLPMYEEWAHIAYMYVNGLIDLNIKTQPLSSKTEVRLCQKG